MSTKSFLIKGKYWKDKCFPGLNDMLAEASRHPMAYNKMKKQYEMIAINSIRRNLRGWKPNGLVYPEYIFYEPKKGQKRDYDNISAAGRKIINDALVKAKVLEDDNPKFLLFGDSKFVYADEPAIEVRLTDGVIQGGNENG